MEGQWKGLLARVRAKCSELGGPQLCLFTQILPGVPVPWGKDAPFSGYRGGTSREDLMTCCGGGSERLPASAAFLHSFSLKQSLRQGAVFWGSVF